MSQIFTEAEDPFLPQAPTKWPSVLGWIMLIWGVLGVIFAIWGFMNKSLAVETYQGLPDWMVAALRAILIFGTAVSILGALSGWYLRKRMRCGYSMTMIWVVLTFLLNVGGLAIQITKSDEMQTLMKRNMLAELEKTKSAHAAIHARNDQGNLVRFSGVRRAHGHTPADCHWSYFVKRKAQGRSRCMATLISVILSSAD